MLHILGYKPANEGVASPVCIDELASCDRQWRDVIQLSTKVDDCVVASTCDYNDTALFSLRKRKLAEFFSNNIQITLHNNDMKSSYPPHGDFPNCFGFEVVAKDSIDEP